MKKLLLFIAIILIATSCTVSLSESTPDNPAKETTVEIQSNVVDTCAIVAVDQNYVYILNKDTKLVQYKLLATTNAYTLVDDFYIIISVMFIVGFIVLLFSVISDRY